MRFVPVKSIEQRAILRLHRLREGLKADRTACINRIRGLLLEFGVAIPAGSAALQRQLDGRACRLSNDRSANKD